jgi:transmembrane sensor
LLLTLWMRSDPWEAKDGMYATAVGQQKRMIRADGSVALLNTNSQIEVEYGENFRDIHLLQGEAYFEVAKNLNQPFRVYAGNGRIQAVGTAFSVLLKVNAVDVTVTEGKVALASLVNTKVTLPEPSGTPPGQTRPDTNNRLIATELGLLSAGQSITIREAAGAEASKASIVDEIEIVDQQEMSKRQSWQRGIITFAGDPLEKVVEEISRYTTVRIEITDPAVRAIKIGGQFPVGETDAMLNALEANFGLRVTRVAEDHVLLASSQDS